MVNIFSLQMYKIIFFTCYA